MDSKIRARLATFVAGMMQGPLGAIPLDRAIRGDLELFISLRASGVTWVQIGNALAAAGARRSDNGNFTVDQIRSSVSRQIRKASTRLDVESEKNLHSTPASEPMRPQSKILKQQQNTQSEHNPSNKTPDTRLVDSPALTILEKLARTRQLRK
ncbi:hypothetical protein AAKU58_000241 [Oxalobacteraceae bacterium GrIS 1.18]